MSLFYVIGLFKSDGTYSIAEKKLVINYIKLRNQFYKRDKLGLN